jgi:membrane protease subunit HflC
MIAIAVGAVLLLILLVFSTTYTVSFHEVAIQRTFGKSSPESVRTEPGLKWKWPIIQDKTEHDTRLQILETTAEEISTADGQQAVVRAFMLWRIDDQTPEGVLAFDQFFRTVDDATQALRAPFVTALTGALSTYQLSDLLGANARLAEAEAKITQNLEPLSRNGIQPVAVGISQVVLPERTTSAVVARMQATRQKLAEAKRYQGTALAEGIAASAATRAETIRSFAELRATEIRSEAEANAAKYLQQMSEEEGLAIFLVWLDTLEAALSQNATFILDPNFAPWHLLMLTSGADDDGPIPLPAQGAGPLPPVVTGAAGSAAETETETLARDGQ